MEGACKYFPCWKQGCTFTHAPGQHDPSSAVPCKNYPCQREDCFFAHKPGQHQCPRHPCNSASCRMHHRPGQHQPSKPVWMLLQINPARKRHEKQLTPAAIAATAATACRTQLTTPEVVSWL